MPYFIFSGYLVFGCEPYPTIIFMLSRNLDLKVRCLRCKFAYSHSATLTNASSISALPIIEPLEWHLPFYAIAPISATPSHKNPPHSWANSQWHRKSFISHNPILCSCADNIDSPRSRTPQRPHTPQLHAAQSCTSRDGTLSICTSRY